jgi:hypothetical protein
MAMTAIFPGVSPLADREIHHVFDPVAAAATWRLFSGRSWIPGPAARLISTGSA